MSRASGPAPALLALLLLACGDAPGEPCTRTGEGFTSRDSCRTTCVVWDVACEGGASVTPDVCTGDPCTRDADCEDGFGCAQTAIDAYACLPASLCPSGFHREHLVTFE